jgi:lipopolysaccharide export system permease protein
VHEESEARVFGSILHRMILLELFRVFAMSLLGITGILVMAAVVAEANQQGFSPSQILAAIPLLIPSTLPYTIPATTLFATCVVYGRLAHDNEILAIKAAGIHLRIVIGPAVVLGLVMSSVTMGLYYSLIPYTHYLLRSNFLNDAEEYLYAVLKKDRCIKMPNLPYCIFVRQVQGKRLVDPLFKRRQERSANYDVIVRAREAELHVDMPNKQVLVHMRHGYLLEERDKVRTYFQDRIWTVPLPPSFGAPREARPRGMSYPALFERRQAILDTIEDKATEIALVVARLAMSNPPASLPQHLTNLQNEQKQRQSEIYNLETEINMRPALSLGCLCFVLVGCPVGIWFSRSDYLSAFISCFLPIVFLYYPMLLCATSYSKQGKVPPSLALFAADVLMAVVAIGLFRRLLKH